MKRLSILSISIGLFVLSLILLPTNTTAYFSDRLASKNNLIKTGSLKVALSYCDTYDCLEEIEVDTNNTGPIYKNKLWQPNDYVVKYFNVRNDGSLPLNYKVNFTSESLPPISKEIMVCATNDSFEVLDLDLNNLKDFTLCESLYTIVTKNIDLANDSLNNFNDRMQTMVFIYLPHDVEYIEEDDSGVLFDVVVSASQTTYREQVYVSTVKQLQEIAQVVNTNQDSFKNKTIVLENDLDLKNIEWQPIGSSEYPFRGSFDGKNHTIKNLIITNQALKNVGLFGRVEGRDSYIKNLTLRNINLAGEKFVGGLAGLVEKASISNINIEGIMISGNSNYTGGIIGSLDGSIYNCNVKKLDINLINLDTKTRTAFNVGGIAGYVSRVDGLYKNLKISNLFISAGNRVGGIFGEASENITIEDCAVKKDYYGSIHIYSQNEPGYIGDFVGKDEINTKFNNCVATDITKRDKNVVVKRSENSITP